MTICHYANLVDHGYSHGDFLPLLATAAPQAYRAELPASEETHLGPHQPAERAVIR